ncbi:MAG: Holliday junction branch migration protein RuvA [Candidatus Gracilibacteria bacterium]|nr:Holliday junction branch migration protein RuvA [Candidatus Gracilibacteria bacterium]
MIAYLKGKILELNFNSLIILTDAGVGYDVGINELTYSKLGLESEAGLFIYHHITENYQSLFGFIEPEEKKVFSELIKISGVGGKVAMQILSLGIERLLFAIKGEDNKTIEGIKGIGKKMAEKIILELKDKDFGIVFTDRDTLKKTNSIAPDLHTSIKSTLTNMGYNPRDIDRILSDLPEGMGSAGDIIPYVIRELS